MTTIPNRPHPAPGSPAPGLALPANGGAMVRLDGFAPKRVVLFAYGKDGTPSCDAEIADFAALQPRFEAAGCVVVGISKDPVKSHDKYLAKKGFGLILASDHGGSLMEEIGAFGDKIFMGKPVRGVLRSSFLIGADGRFVQSWTVDRVAGHAAAVLAAVEG